MFTKNLEKYMKRQDNHNNLVEERKEARDLINQQKNEIVRPTHEELIIFDTLFTELQRLNKITFEVHALIEDLEQRKDYIVPNAFNVEYNTLQQRLDNTNYQAYAIKKQIRNKAQKYLKFTGRIPEALGGRVYKEEVHSYNRVDRRIQNILNSLDEEQSYGEQLAQEYKRRFNGMMPKEFQ
ncbi:hypothetical protein [Mammaliicoccus lentus]|uniref:hypothetical protein n=1 Tax=Mammaliicoccus lentus TaxID=42858 RepID=UPI002DB637A7|nr:hypothetical protein [Mammaliicoccus lentus]MEB5686661.1 hypothetical protein [Mammaliicoccus lentus]